MEFSGKRIKSGSGGVVYDVGNNTCYKKIFNHEYMNNRDGIEILNTIKNLKLFNFCKLFEIFHDSDYIYGYTMERICEKDIDILGISKTYLLNSYTNLYMSMMILAENDIYANDFGFHNVFITSEGIIAYDYDLYVKNNKYSAKTRNLAKLNSMFNELLNHEIETKYPSINPNVAVLKVNELFNFKTDPETLKEKLERYESILDYMEDSYEKKH